MGPVEDGDSIVQQDRDSRARTFSYDPAKPLEHGLHIPPADSAGRRMGEDRLERPAMAPVHLLMIAFSAVSANLIVHLEAHPELGRHAAAASQTQGRICGDAPFARDDLVDAPGHSQGQRQAVPTQIHRLDSWVDEDGNELIFSSDGTFDGSESGVWAAEGGILTVYEPEAYDYEINGQTLTISTEGWWWSPRGSSKGRNSFTLESSVNCSFGITPKDMVPTCMHPPGIYEEKDKIHLAVFRSCRRFFWIYESAARQRRHACGK